MTAPRGDLLAQGATTRTRLLYDGAGRVVGVEKRLTERFRGDSAARALLCVEAAVLRALDGRGAPLLLGSGGGVGADDDVEPWLVMEHLSMRSLEEAAARHASGRAAFVASVVDAVFGALALVHDAFDARGPLLVVHGDVSPANLVVAADGASARLVDFGLAGFRDAPLHGSSALRGTPLYIAPEVARGEPATARSDLFSLGLSLLHAASGEPPRASLSLAPLLLLAGEASVTDYAARVGSRLPPRLRDALLAVTSFDPEARPSHAREAWRAGAW